MNQTILHIIDSLEIGGAEVLLTGVVTSMKEYNHVIVTLTGKNAFEKQLIRYKIYSLGYKNKLSIPASIRRLKKIMKDHKVDIIHAHLLPSTFLARFANSGDIPFFFTVHNILSKSAFKLSTLSFLLEKFSYKADQRAIFVSEDVREDYHNKIGIKGREFLLHNFVEDHFFNEKWSKKEVTIDEPVKLVSIGSLKDQKNYKFLIESLSKFDQNFKLDIYGSGPLYDELSNNISSLNLEDKIFLKGRKKNLYQVLHNYDIYIMTSRYEGFGISLVEAMAIGLPTLVSKVDTLINISNETSFFFEPGNSVDFVNKLSAMIRNPDQLETKSKEGKKRAFQISNKKKYINQLRAIYSAE
jgi:glycosyltransferase involved in cell wall biosynthesis